MGGELRSAQRSQDPVSERGTNLRDNGENLQKAGGQLEGAAGVHDGPRAGPERHQYGENSN